MKPYLKYIIPAIIIVLIVGIYIYKKPKNTETTKPASRKVEQINQLALKDRPFVTLTPRSDGKEVTLGIDKVTNATKVEYEMEYQADNLIQGVFGNIDFTQEPTPVAKNLLFGSCSKGKCRYDENVSGGSLTLRFDGGSEAYTLKSDFNLQNMFDRQGVFTSKDIKATLDVGKSGLPSATYLIISGTMGLPAPVDGEVLAGPYAFLAADKQTLKSAALTIQSKDDLTGA
ncbi:MAG: hypothetical protein AAB580_00965, partial [Patescibacteria group bacterium]